MKYIAEFSLQNGDNVLVEINEMEDEGRGRVSRGDRFVKASMTLEEALDNVKSSAEAVLSKLKTLSELPDEIEVEFGIKLDTEIGAFVASAGLEAHYRVSMKWQNKAE